MLGLIRFRLFERRLRQNSEDSQALHSMVESLRVSGADVLCSAVSSVTASCLSQRVLQLKAGRHAAAPATHDAAHQAPTLAPATALAPAPK
eukprot:1782216-Amphidinium_carterae.1